MNPGPDALDVVCDTPGPDRARFAFDAIDVRGRVTGAATEVEVEVRIAGRTHPLAIEGRPGPDVTPAPPGLPFLGSVPTAGLARGRHAITVVARDATGREAVAVTEVDVQPFAVMPSTFDRWPALVAAGDPVVHVLGCTPAAPRPGWPAPVAVTGFAYCTQGLDRLALIVDGHLEVAPFHGLYRPDLETVLASRAAVAAGWRAELLDLDGSPGDHELVVLAVAPDGRAAGWRGPLPALRPAASATDDDEAALPALSPAPRRRPDGAALAGPPPRGRHRWRRLAEQWAERALRAEAAREAADTDHAWAGLQTRLAIERAADRELGRRATAALAGRPIAFPPVERPVVSIVITVHAGAALTERCLRALLHAGDAVPFEVVVVDDGDDPAVAALLDDVAGIRVLRNRPSLGYLRSANRGAAAARGTHVVQLNNDTEPQPGWLDALVARLGDDDVGVVAAKLLFPDGRLQEAGSIVWADGQGWNYGIGEDETAPAYNVPRDVDYGSAAALLVRGSLWRDLGGFDERFSPAYYEDVDLCFAARARGLRVVYEPAARVVHVRGGSMGAGALGVSRDLIDAHRATFCRKWADALADQPVFHPDRVVAAADRARRS